jgi:hypothetical protein
MCVCALPSCRPCPARLPACWAGGMGRWRGALNVQGWGVTCCCYSCSALIRHTGRWPPFHACHRGSSELHRVYVTWALEKRQRVTHRHGRTAQQHPRSRCFLCASQWHMVVCSSACCDINAATPLTCCAVARAAAAAVSLRAREPLEAAASGHHLARHLLQRCLWAQPTADGLCHTATGREHGRRRHTAGPATIPRQRAALVCGSVQLRPLG